jgi:hypothetical protein
MRSFYNEIQDVIERKDIHLDGTFVANPRIESAYEKPILSSIATHVMALPNTTPRRYNIA